MIVPRVVVVGAGMVADLHIRAARTGHHLEIVGFLDTDEARKANRSAEWQIPSLDSLADALADQKVDGILVLTPVESHAEIAVQALNAGKHVFIEKPVASREEIKVIAEASASSGKVCFPGHNYAYDSHFTQLRSLVQSGELGSLRALFIHYVIAHPEEVARHYGGVLGEVMIHHAYLTVALLGRPSHITAGTTEPQWAEHDAEDQAWMTWDYPGGLTVHLFATFAVNDDSMAPWMFTVKALGTNGSSSYEWKSSTFRRALGSLSFAIPAYENSYIYEHEAFAAAIGGDPTRIVSSIEDALLTQELIDLAHESARTGSRCRVGEEIKVANGRSK
jgi:predicted dehydrogenase